MNGYEIDFLGHVIALDMVTLSGLVCALVFASGFRFALLNESRIQQAEKDC